MRHTTKYLMLALLVLAAAACRHTPTAPKETAEPYAGRRDTLWVCAGVTQHQPCK